VDVAVSTSDLHAEGLLMENTPAEMSLAARQANAWYPAMLYILTRGEARGDREAHPQSEFWPPLAPGMKFLMCNWTVSRR